MGIWKTIFGGGNVVKEVADLIDDIHTSDAEEKELQIQAGQAKTQSKIDLLKAYHPFKVAQRVMAWAFTANFIVSFWVAVYLWAADKDMDGFIEIMGVFHLGWIMLTIVGFYFSGGTIEGIIDKVKKPKQ